jgi:hypothetical protein
VGKVLDYRVVGWMTRLPYLPYSTVHRE